MLKWPTQGISVFPARGHFSGNVWFAHGISLDLLDPSEKEVEYISCWACSPSSLCFSGSSRGAEPHGLRPLPWLICQSCFIFRKSALMWELLCVTPAHSAPLYWGSHSCSLLFALWQLCPFLKNIIFSFITIGEEAKLREAKGKELLECSQMHCHCKRELFSCHFPAFFHLFLRTECLMFIQLNILKSRLLPPEFIIYIFLLASCLNLST